MRQDIRDNACFICLEPGGVMHCKCPEDSGMYAHNNCLARWNVQRAGQYEETHCRFCHAQLPDWKESLLPDLQSPRTRIIKPTMAIHFGDQKHIVNVNPGPEGMAEFKRTVKKLFGLPSDAQFDVSFQVPVPSFGRPQTTQQHGWNGPQLNLNGFSQFEAVAAMAQAHRNWRQRAMQQQQPSVSSPPPPLPHAYPFGLPQPQSAVAQAAAEALAVKVAAKAAEARAAAAREAAAAARVGIASLVPINMQKFGGCGKRERERSPVRSACGLHGNDEGVEGILPGLQRIRTRPASSQFCQQQQAHMPAVDASGISASSISYALASSSGRPRRSSVCDLEGVQAPPAGWLV